MRDGFYAHSDFSSRRARVSERESEREREREREEGLESMLVYPMGLRGGGGGAGGRGELLRFNVA